MIFANRSVGARHVEDPPQEDRARLRQMQTPAAPACELSLPHALNSVSLFVAVFAHHEASTQI
jgi:hypothetical protein